jgi:hypothetical protein
MLPQTTAASPSIDVASKPNKLAAHRAGGDSRRMIAGWRARIGEECASPRSYRDEDCDGQLRRRGSRAIFRRQFFRAPVDGAILGRKRLAQLATSENKGSMPLA